MYQRTTLKIVDDISVVVPNSLNLITTYVLAEQGDWFEDEIKFVRLLLKPGQQAIDIGANYGLFTLSMAKVVGSTGCIWAFEPASSTAAFLADSLALNGFSQVTLDQRALSARAGTAQLFLNDNSELNEIVRDGGTQVAGTTETVTLVTLDGAQEQYGWSGIEFVKIDAEGEEAAIIRGGRDFFRTQSPLVQYEVKAGSVIHHELIQAFADIGYASYRLVSGLNVLIPFDAGEAIDGYQLNLFCCKPDRAERLAADHFLVLADTIKATSISQQTNDLLDDVNTNDAFGWQKKLTQLPYGVRLFESWQHTVSQGRSAEVERALALHSIAHDRKQSLPKRVIALRASLTILTTICDLQPGFLRYMSLARVALEFGSRVVAVNALNKLFNHVKTERQIDPTEPFLSASERFDVLDPGDSLGNWIVCALLETLERNVSFSSFYTGSASRQRLEEIRNLKFGSAEMARRLELVNLRFPA
jgi:FkbM family methyltransferase